MNTTEEYIFHEHLKNLNTRWEDFSREIKDLQTPDTFSILYATDIHYIRKYAKYVPVYYKLKDMVEFSKYAGFDLLALTGDIVDGNASLKRQKRDLYDLVSIIREAKTTSVVISRGNHDDNSWYTIKNNLDTESVLSKEDWYSHVINPIRVQYPIALDEENFSGGYYYVDFPFHKIRVINLNTSDVPNITDNKGKLLREYCGQWNSGVNEKQLMWLRDALIMDKPGWSVIFMSHDFPVNKYGEEPFRNDTLLWDIIKAYKNGEKGVAKSAEKYYEAEISYDFTNNKSNEIIAYFFGHIHKDIEFVQDGINAISTQNLLGTVEKPWDSTYAETDGGWDCILVDRKRRTIKTIRHGAPKRRTIHF